MLDTLTACALPATVCSASSGPVNVTVIASGVGGGTGDAPYGGLGGTEPRASGGPVTGAPPTRPLVAACHRRQLNASPGISRC